MRNVASSLSCKSFVGFCGLRHLRTFDIEILTQRVEAATFPKILVVEVKQSTGWLYMLWQQCTVCEIRISNKLLMCFVYDP